MDHPPVPGEARRMTQPAPEVRPPKADSSRDPYPETASNSDRLRRPARVHPVLGPAGFECRMAGTLLPSGFPRTMDWRHDGCGKP